MVEAAWLEALAADERTMAVQLANLPPSYAIMHDLRLPGSKGNIDHLVVGPGGAFVVLTRRCTEAVTFRDGQLWAGDLPLRDTLEAAKVESQLLTQSLATPVVPIVALLGIVLPAAAPSSIENVLVCAGDHVVRVVTRGSHTLLAPHKVSEAAERALPLLHNAGSVARTESGLGVRADPPPDTSVTPVVPPSARASAESVQRRNEIRSSKERKGRRHSASDGGNDRARPGVAEQPAKPAKERSGRARSLRFIVAAIVSLCLAAVALGSLVRVIWSDGGSTRRPAAPSNTAIVAPATTTGASPRTALAASLPAPRVEFAPTCPAPGAGWQLQPVWPGDIVGLVRYEVEIQSLDGSWSQLAPLATADTPWDALTAQPANATYTVRITAAMSDGSRSVNAPAVVSAPSAPC